MKGILNIEGKWMKKLAIGVDFLILNTLFLLLFITGVFGIPGMIALNNTLFQFISGKQNKLVGRFITNFRLNLGVGLRLSLIMLPLIFIEGLNIFFSFQLTNIVLLQKMLSIGILFVTLIIFETIIFYFSRYDSKLKIGIKNAIVILLYNPKYLLFEVLSVLAIIIFLIPEGMVTGLYFFTFGGVTIIQYCKCRYILKMFKKYELLLIQIGES